MNPFTDRIPLDPKFRESLRKSHDSTIGSRRAIEKHGAKLNFVINPDNPRYNPLATLEERKAWDEKRAANKGRTK